MGTNVIVGISIGAFAFVLVVILLVCYCVRKRMEVVGEEMGVGMEGSTTVGIGASMRHGCVLQSQPLHIVFGRDGGFDPWK